MIVVDGRNLSLEHALQSAFEHHRSGRLEQAEQLYAAILEHAPDHAEAWHLAGVCSHQRGQHPQAVTRIRRAIELNASDPGYHNNLGIALRALKRFDEAAAALQTALRLKPDYASACLNLGNVWKDLGRLEPAAECYRQAVHHNPDSAESHGNLANVLKTLGQFELAIAHYRVALGLKPRLPELHHNLGNALKEQGLLAEAVEHYRQALQLKPGYPSAALHLGHALKALGLLGEAMECYRNALQLEPGNPEIRSSLIAQMQALCAWDGLQALLEAQRRDATDPASAPIPPFQFLCIPSTGREQRACAEKWAQAHLAPFASMRAELGFDQPRPAGGKLRIGYLSADFHLHATAYLIAELFELHDRRDFEIFAYSYGRADASPMRRRLSAACDRFVDLRDASLPAAARQIHADRIDILIDLKGYTRHARSEILALRPAPVQAHYLGYPGTLGMECVDYFLTDRFISPPDQAQCFSEKLVYLPECYQINDRQRTIAEPGPSRADCGLPEAGFVFCCLNNPYKITPEIFDIWLRLLQAVDGSVLWLLQGAAPQPENLKLEARRRGVAPERLVFAPKLALAEHLARYRLADLFLDTFPVNAHTTASDALWAGLPLLSCSGETFVSRVAGSLLHNAGLPELAVSNLRDYEMLALRLARDPSELARLRQQLAQNRSSCPLFDSVRFTRHLETAYRLMWARHLSGAPPHAIEVPALPAV